MPSNRSTAGIWLLTRASAGNVERAEDRSGTGTADSPQAAGDPRSRGPVHLERIFRQEQDTLRDAEVDTATASRSNKQDTDQVSQDNQALSRQARQPFAPIRTGEFSQT